jgi:rhamnogalacturonan endolyase
MKRQIPVFIFLFIFFTASAQKDKLLFEDNFSAALDTSHWFVEKQKADSEIVITKNGKLLMDTYGGVTIWYKKELSGNIRISYKRKVIIAGGKNDRLSDLNQFWMATDPQGKMFTRHGGFAEYDSLDMYYVGMGGNYNKTTRFRKYNNGDKKIIAEFSDSLHLLQANAVYFIAITIKDGLVQFAVDGTVYFTWKDEHPFIHGYFGIRSTRSRQEVDEVKIWQLN